jgi:hypothetical protein
MSEPNPSHFVVGLPAPMPFGMTLERIYHLVRSHLRLFLAIGSVIGAALFLLYIAFGAVIGFSGLIPKATNPDPTQIMRTLLPLELLLAVPMLVVFALYLAATLYAALNADASVTVTFRQSYAAAWHKAGRYIWLLFWIYLRAFGPVILTVLIVCGGSGLIVFLTANQGSSLMLALIPLGIFLAIALYVYGIIVALRLSLAIPAAISESLTASQALRRSTQLTYGAKGRIFLILLVVDLVCGLGIFAVEVVAIVLGFIAVAIGSAFHMQVKDPITIAAIVLGGLVIACLFLMVIVITYSALIASLAVLYNDQRRRYDSLLGPAAAGVGPVSQA